jgi:hypothetical protein
MEAHLCSVKSVLDSTVYPNCFNSEATGDETEASNRSALRKIFGRLIIATLALDKGIFTLI